MSRVKRRASRRFLKPAGVQAEVLTIEPLVFEFCAFKASVNLLINDSNCPSVVAIAPCAAITEASLLKLPALPCAVASLSWASSCCNCFSSWAISLAISCCKAELELEGVPPEPLAAPAPLTAVGAALSAPVGPEADVEVVPALFVGTPDEAFSVLAASGLTFALTIFNPVYFDYLHSIGQ